MSAPFAYNVIRAPGRLVKGPTDLNTAYPHGGTELGVVRTMEFRLGIKTKRLIAEEFNRPVATILEGEEAVMAGVLRSWDNDLIAYLFPNTQTGAKTGKIAVEGFANSGNRAGANLSSLKGAKILFSPDAVDDVPMILMYNAVPKIEESTALALRITEEYGIAFVLGCEPDQRGWDYRVMYRDDLVNGSYL